jgi:hypothetical protein
MWEIGTPSKVGWYLTAWRLGDGFVYSVGKWDGSEWISRMGEPHTFQEIKSPDEQDKMLDELHETQNLK